VPDLAALILEHYRRHARDFPWRRTRDPYAIWICEVMAQQTRLETVLPYWQRWLARFPTPAALAAAPLDDVLAHWAGLGYYARARALHAAAAVIVAEHGGRFPAEPAAIAALPGVGPYTAGAVGSIAFGQRVPVVDGNVTRVLARLHALDDTTSPAGKRRLWELAAAAVPARAPGDFNQGLMDLGATLCTPRAPRCPECPVAALCCARAEGRQAELPRARVRPTARAHTVDVAWIVDRGRCLIARRRPGGLYGGLWELPETAALGVEATGAPLCSHTQHLTHRTLTYRVFAASAPAATVAPPYDRFEWVRPDELAARGISSATARLVRLITAPQKGNPASWPTPREPSSSTARASKRSSKGSTSSATRPAPMRTSPRPRRGRRAASPR
jgi:A/G-specific adenine glycosylase